MKTCRTCNLNKVTTSFQVRGSSSDGLTSSCKKCISIKRKESYNRNPSYQIGLSKTYSKALHAQNTLYIADYLLTHPCADCGNSDILVLEFDHINDNKLFDISFMIRKLTLERVKEEISKCEVRCVNCHKKVTKARREIL
jgi:hypothetical protein